MCLCNLLGSYSFFFLCMHMWLIPHQKIMYKNRKKSKNGTLLSISRELGIILQKAFFLFSLFLWNAVLKEVVSAFVSICSKKDSVKQYTERRWPNSGCDILLSYFTKHRVLSLNRSLVALHDKTMPSLCGPASLQTGETTAALSGVCTALCLKISGSFILSYLIRHFHYVPPKWKMRTYPLQQIHVEILWQLHWNYVCTFPQAHLNDKGLRS